MARDYRDKESNGHSDFSQSFSGILSVLDRNGCDSVLFSPYTFIKRPDFDVTLPLNTLTNIRSIFVEEFMMDNCSRTNIESIVYFKDEDGWSNYQLGGPRFAKLKYTDSFEKTIIEPFKKEVAEQRIFGNCTMLLCGEINVIKYSKVNKAVHDKFEYLTTLNSNIDVFLNPIHDRITRFEIKLKQKFLSENNRWVVSVWNKGKKDKNCKVRDGKEPSWRAFFNGQEKQIEFIQHEISTNGHIEIGCLDLMSNKEI